MEDSSSKIKVLMAGGGTGGHLYPALALVEELEKRNLLAEVVFVGTSRGLEARVVPQAGYPLKLISIRGLRRRLSWENLLIPFQLIASLIQSARILWRFRPDAVIGTGGYVSGPVLFMAALMGIPTLIQEQNSYPGIATRILARWVDQVHLSFEESVKYFRNKANLRVSGNPVRHQLFQGDRQVAAKIFHLDPQKKTLFVFGGSQGAHRINLALLDILDRLLNFQDVQILWATGERDYEMVGQSCAQYGDRVCAKPYIDNMAAAYAISDLALCRAGATTITELALVGLPSILIPFPYATAGHQQFNAQALVNQGAAVMILEKDLSPDRLLTTIHELLENESQRKTMRKKAREWAKPQAASQIIDSLVELLIKKRKSENVKYDLIFPFILRPKNKQ
ncbi:MAG: undecaprenyldiphospho-muramoylpentapeptide beta-N-acetylglucosaminyltransferase [candidate division KSB1 bacterium]|nr:undecaprenyldiphospho-muramoylpentapeptide beta-N-acetylglucosaminyltransferase [candidate division KSB1 bacterium]